MIFKILFAINFALFSDATVEGFEFVAFYDCCPHCRKKLELDEDEEKNCPFCGAKGINPGRGMRYILVIDKDEETHHLQGFMDSIESFLPKCEEEEMEGNLNEVYEGKSCNIFYRYKSFYKEL